MLNKEQDACIEMHYRGLYKKMLSYAMYTLRDASLSEEAVQDAFMIACAKIDVFYASKNPEGWLINALRNVIRNMKKLRITLNKYVVQLLDTENIIDTGNFTAEQDFELIFGDIVKSDDFKLLRKVVLDKYTMLEASIEFGITLDACKKRVQRIKKKLKETHQTDS